MASRNASENPAGIETDRSIDIYLKYIVATHQKTQQGLKHHADCDIEAEIESQRIRKPSRD